MHTELIDDLFSCVAWDDLAQVHDAADKALTSLADPAILAAFWDRMAGDEELCRAAESFNAFRKFVLHDNRTAGFRVRLHMFSDLMVEEAHNHRASFSARVLRGSYRHVLYGSVEEVWRGGAEVPEQRPEPRFVQDQPPGSSYTLHHAFVHSTYALPETVSLVIQGPRVRPSFRIYDLARGVGRTRVGAAQQSEVQEPGERRSGMEEISAAGRRLSDWGLFG